jgi:hypothetical protein
MTVELPLLTASALLTASRKEIWEAWTTPQGIKTFLAPDCKIEFQVGGAYEIYFDPQAAPQDRGSKRVCHPCHSTDGNVFLFLVQPSLVTKDPLAIHACFNPYTRDNQ